MDCLAAPTAQVPIWWRGIEGEPPAAKFIAATRERTGEGPTFSELFRDLLPEGNGVPSSLSELTWFQRRQVVQSFRRHCAIQWRRHGRITWEHRVERSLRTGGKFRRQSRDPHEGDPAETPTRAPAASS